MFVCNLKEAFSLIVFINADMQIFKQLADWVQNAYFYARTFMHTRKVRSL